MTTPKPKLSHEDFTNKRSSLLAQLNDAINKKDRRRQQALRRQLQSDDLVP